MGHSPRNTSQHPALPSGLVLSHGNNVPAGKSHLLPLLSCPTATLPHPAKPGSSARPQQSPASAWRASGSLQCQRASTGEGWGVFIAYSDSCLISSRLQALAHVLPGWAQAWGGTRGRHRTSAATWACPSVCGHTYWEDTHGFGSFGSKGCPTSIAGSMPWAHGRWCLWHRGGTGVGCC